MYSIITSGVLSRGLKKFTVGTLSALATQANNLAAGSWASLTGSSGLNYALITDPSGVANILDFCNKGGRDTVAKRCIFQGGAHTGAGGLTGAFILDETSHTWSQITPSYSSTLSHNWDSSCVDPTRGDFYAFSKTSSTVRRLPSGSTTWSTIATLSISTPESLSLFWDEGRDGLMAWNRNTGLEFWAYSSGVGSWTNLGNPGINGDLGMYGGYCTNGELFLSDGQVNTTKFWIYQTNNTFSSALTAPVAVYVAQGTANIVNADSSSGRILVTNKVTGAMSAYLPTTRTWKTVTPTNGNVPLGVNLANTDAFSIDLRDLGCTMYFSGNNNGDTPSVYLYKHTASVES